jgi:chromosome condensin MukBEF MukE localization factor
MNELPFCSDQIMKQEQYRDLLREAEHYRLMKAVNQSEPDLPQNSNVLQLKALANLARHIPSLGPISHART